MRGGHAQGQDSTGRRQRVEERGSSIWIVCAGATRDVSRGRVECPQRGIVNAKECLGCHLLVTIAHERDLRLACSTAG